MKKYIYIGLGGVLGAMLRFVIEGIQTSGLKVDIPINTLLINIAGSFLLALIFTIRYGVFHKNDNIKLGITTGFLGAFTTFSTMCKEAVRLVNQGNAGTAFIYIGLSTIIGLSAAYFGSIAGRGVNHMLQSGRENNLETASDDLREGDDI